MKSITVKFVKTIIFSSLIISLLSPLTGKVKIKDLPEKYRKWLTEDVTYIITPMEKKVFLELESSRERDLFIDAFWQNRDPNPNTAENEFRTEHYRRIQYANRTFGRGTPTKGWRTEMGRIYIILGEPNSIDRYETLSEIYPMIVWFYQGMVKFGLPNAFNVVFFKKEGSGDYILYSPVKHGPGSLLIHNYSIDPQDYLSAYTELKGIDPNIARVSLSLIEGEQRSATSPSISSEILLSQKIVETPRKKVNDAYASKLLKYKKYIQSDYSINYVDSSNMVMINRDEQTGIANVHYLLEPKKLTLEQYDNTFYANLEINGSVVDSEENTIYQFARKVPIKLEQGQLEKIQSKLFSFQAFFPMIEGEYTLNLLFRNTVSKEFTSIEKKIVVPAFDPSKPRIDSLMVANRIQKATQNTELEKPFVFNSIQMVPSPRNDFSTKDTLYLYYKLQGLSPEQQQHSIIKYTILKDQEVILNRSKKLADYTSKTNILEEFSLQDLKPAYYSIRVSLNEDNRSLAMQETNFYISPLSNLSRPWVVSLSNETDSAIILNIIGNQYLNKKEYKQAYIHLERAYNLKPVSPQLALDFSKILLLAKQYSKIKRVGTPFITTEHKNVFWGILGQASQGLGQFEEAIQYYKNFLEYYGTNINILNSIGDCYVKLGDKEEALVAWERSLELEPGQAKLKARIKALKTSTPSKGETGNE